MFFTSSKKLFSFLRYSNFCNFFPSFPHFPDSNGSESGIIYDVWTDLHKFADIIFGITQKLLYITSSSLVRQYVTNKGMFLTCFVTWRVTGH